MPKQTNSLVPLDSEDTSISVAEARHMARKHMLVTALEALFELGMNHEVKEAVRANALQFIINFASEAQGGGASTLGKLSPQAARLIAKLGLNSGTNNGLDRQESSEPLAKTVQGDKQGDD